MQERKKKSELCFSIKSTLSAITRGIEKKRIRGGAIRGERTRLWMDRLTLRSSSQLLIRLFIALSIIEKVLTAPPGEKAGSNKKRRKSSDQRWRFVRKTGFARNGASFTSFARPATGLSAMLSERIAIFSAGKRVLLNLIDWCPRKRCN